MRQNVERVLERDTKLSELDARAESLNAASVQFATSSRRVKQKMWWENLKMQLIIGGVVLALIIIILAVLGVKFGGGDDHADDELQVVDVN